MKSALRTVARKVNRSWPVRRLDEAYLELTWRLAPEWYCRLFNMRAAVGGKDVRFAFDRAKNRYEARSARHSRRFHAKYQNMLCYGSGLERRGQDLGAKYLLPRITFRAGDVVVDCGANVGDLKLYLDALGVPVQYIGIEPSPQEYACLVENVAPSATYNVALWHTDTELEFYVSSHFADSSAIMPGAYSHTVTVQARRLDSLISGPVRLLKIEAEGAEPEVLAGSAGILPSVDYIAADLGFERGIARESTLAPVINLLAGRGFELLQVAYPQMVALFRRTGLVDDPPSRAGT